MNKEDFVKFHELLAKLKFEIAQDTYNENLTPEYRTECENMLHAIDLLMQVTRILVDSEVPTIHV